MKKRIFSLLFALALCLSLLPTVALAEGTAEQFNLTPGGTYWFDLSGENIPGTVNTGNDWGAVSVPDTTLHYVPFTYAGTVDAYVLNSSSIGQTGAAEAASQTTDESGQYGYKYPHSLFVADYAVKYTVSWNQLNTAGLIFGKSYTGGSVDYTLRAPSMGSWSTGLGDTERGTPQSNEWDAVLDKNSGYIKNWNGIYAWGQDTEKYGSSVRVHRGCSSARYFNYYFGYTQNAYVGFRPVLEVLNTDALSPDGLKAVTLDLNGGKLGGSTENIQIIVKNGAAFTAPASDGLTAPTGYNATGFKWQDSDGNLYAPGDSVPADVTLLTAKWVKSVSTEDELREALDAGATSIKLVGDIKLSSTLDLTDKNIILDLNGYVLTGNIQLADSSASPDSILTLIDSNPTATHADSSLPAGGVVKGNITLTRGNYGTASHLYANGGTVTGKVSLNSYVAKIHCTSDTPTAIKGYAGNSGEIHGGIFYGSINESCIKEKTVTFMNGSSRYALEVVANGSKAVAPIEPTKTGYIFSGWYTDAGCTAKYDFATTVTESLTLYAKWTPNTYTVRFNSQGGSEVNSQNVNHGSTATKPKTDPTKTGYTFGGWYTDAGCTAKYNFATTVTGNLTLYAKWTVNQYTITFNTDGGNTIDPITQDYGTEVTAPENPTKTGYTFNGWDKTIPQTMPAEDMTITAQWNINQYTITFDTDGGSEVASITQDYGTAITAPENPTKTGYTFNGWDKTIPQTMPAEDMTIKAKWTVNQYTITFDTDGGSEVASITQDYGTAITAPENPTKTGYTFAGWDTTIPNTMPAGDMTITANWTVNQYTITYDLDGGTVEGNPDSYTVETDTFTLNNPTKRGYTFTGWSGTGLTGENNLTVTIETGSTGDRNYTAHWRYNVSHIPTYPITVESARHGTVTVAPKTASKGTTVTLTVEPDKGYTLETLTVTDKSGNEIELTSKGDGKYTFTMPASKVTVKATFMEDNSMLNFFVDVFPGDYYYDAVLWAAENGITGGVDDTHFAPNGICTRAQAVTFLWRAAGCPAPKSSEMPFKDVVKGSYYYDAVLWAVENGITKGTSDTTFSPDATCTRGQIVTFLWRSQGSPAAAGENTFTDVAADSYCADAVLWAVENGITNGTSDSAFSPANDCTRAQIVTFLYRCLGGE